MNYNKEHSQHTRKCKAIRALHGLTEKDISELLGVGQATVYRYEREMIKDTPAASKLNNFYKTLYALEVSANENLV